MPRPAGLDAYYAFGPNGETAFSVEATAVRFGPGVLGEIGADAAALGLRRVALFTDARVRRLLPVATALASLRAAGVDAALYDEVAVEPSEESAAAAARFAAEAGVDGFVSIGGGSVIDTTKLANLLSSWPAPLRDYASPPFGAGKPVPGPLKPHIACPTTFGTAAETTGIAVLHLHGFAAKTGIVSRRLKPTLGLQDPTALASLPPLVVASNGFDVLILGVLALASAFGVMLAVPPMPAHHPAAPTEPTAAQEPALPAPLARRGLLALSAIGVVDSATRAGFLTFLPFLLAARGASVPLIGAALTAVFLGGAGGKFVCGVLANRVGVLRTVLITETATSLGIIALLAAPLPVILALLVPLGAVLNGTSSVLYGTRCFMPPESVWG